MRATPESGARGRLGPAAGRWGVEDAGEPTGHASGLGSWTASPDTCCTRALLSSSGLHSSHTSPCASTWPEPGPWSLPACDVEKASIRLRMLP